MDTGKIAAFVGAAISIAFGVALLWFPPTSMVNADGTAQAGTVGAAFSFVTGGLGAIGVTVGIPAVRNAAIREGVQRGMAAPTSGARTPQ